MPYGYTQPGNWKTTRKRILTRDSESCFKCGAFANQVDHIVPVSQGGTHDDDNLAAICTPCHRDKSEGERRAGWVARRASARTSTKRKAEAHPGSL